MLKAYDFAVGHVGLDVASGPIWAEYLEFTQSNYYKLVNYTIFIKCSVKCGTLGK